MNFFKSILSDDPDPPLEQKSHDSGPNSPSNPSQEIRKENAPVSDQSVEKSNPNVSADSGGFGGGWSFGGLVKNFATRSESMLEVYRRDLQEFGSGLRKETEILREVASRAVKELPASIEVGASVAQGSLESVGHAFDGVLKSTAEIISQGKETLLASSDVESETPDASRLSNSGRYSRFDAQLTALQNDSNTYCEEPSDSEEYKKWKSEFSLEDYSEEIENLIGENGVLEGVYRRLVVPNVVDSDIFWSRYFYRVHKLKQQESMRANLVKRAISVDDEEELSWDVDDDDDYNDQDKNAKLKGEEVEKKTLDVQTSGPVEKQESISEETKNASSETVDVEGEDKSTEEVVDKGRVIESSEASASDKKVISEESSQLKDEDNVVKVDENVSSEGKGDHSESGKDSDISVISSQPSGQEEEDLGWDEIEDIGSDDDKKANSVTPGESASGADLRKRLSAADEDEDLSWDIEDDDEHVKA